MQVEQETVEDIIKAFRKYEQGQTDDEEILKNTKERLLQLNQVQEQRYLQLQIMLQQQQAKIEQLRDQQNQINYFKKEILNLTIQNEKKQQEVQELHQQLQKEQIIYEDIVVKEKHLTNKLELEKKHFEQKNQELIKQRQIVGQTPIKLNDKISQFELKIETIEKQLQIEKQKLENETELLKYNLEKGQETVKEFNNIKLYESQNPQMEQINISSILFKKEEDNFDKKKMMDKLLQHRQFAEANLNETKNQEKYYQEKIIKHRQSISQLQKQIQDLQLQNDNLAKVSFSDQESQLNSLCLQNQELRESNQSLAQKVQELKSIMEDGFKKQEQRQVELKEDQEFFDQETSRQNENFQQQVNYYKTQLQDTINEGIRVIKLQKSLVKVKNRFFDSLQKDLLF